MVGVAAFGPRAAVLVAAALIAVAVAAFATGTTAPAATITTATVVAAAAAVVAITAGFTRLTCGPGVFQFLAGFLIAFYLLSITWIAPKIGIGNAVFLVLIGQLISAAAIDHFGLFGANQTPISLTRAAGIAIMAVGVFVTQKV